MVEGYTKVVVSVLFRSCDAMVVTNLGHLHTIPTPILAPVRFHNMMFFGAEGVSISVSDVQPVLDVPKEPRHQLVRLVIIRLESLSFWRFWWACC